MPDSIREQIVAALENRLKTITVADGYNFDLATKVFIWRDSEYAEEELPALNIMDVEEDTSNLSVQSQQEQLLKVEIHGMNMATAADGTTKTTKLNATQIRKLNSDITKALGVDTRLGGLSIDILPGKSEIEVAQDKKTVAGLKRTVYVKYRTKRFDPYTQP